MQYRRWLVDAVLPHGSKHGETFFFESPTGEPLPPPPPVIGEETLKDIYEAAKKGDVDAGAAMSRIAYAFLSHSQMPVPLAKHIQALLLKDFTTPPKRGKGGDGYANTARNLFIIDAVSALQQAGVHPTQNRAKRDSGKSGCAIVAKALAGIGIHIDATGVETVWAERSRYVRG